MQVLQARWVCRCGFTKDTTQLKGTLGLPLDADFTLPAQLSEARSTGIAAIKCTTAQRKLSSSTSKCTHVIYITKTISTLNYEPGLCITSSACYISVIICLGAGSISIFGKKSHMKKSFFLVFPVGWAYTQGDPRQDVLHFNPLVVFYVLYTLIQLTAQLNMYMVIHTLQMLCRLDCSPISYLHFTDRQSHPINIVNIVSTLTY